MLNRLVSRTIFTLVAGAAWLALAPSALATPIVGGGIDDGEACLDTASSCPGEADFLVVPVGSATGTIVRTPSGGGFYSIDLNVSVASLTMEGAFDGVDRIEFTNLTFEVSSWTAFDIGPSLVNTAPIIGMVSGTYEQFLGAASVAGPQNFVQAVAFSNFNCTDQPTGNCGFGVGFLDSLTNPSIHLDVGTTGGGTDHQFEWTFNVAIPEPTTAALLGLGLVGLAGLRRRR